MKCWLPIVAALALLVQATPVTADETGVVWLDVIELNANEVDRLIRDAMQAITDGDRDRAIAAYTEAVDLAPDRMDALVLELDLRVDQEDWAGILDRTAGLAESTTTEVDAVRSLFFRAIALAATGDYENGAELLERITRFRSDLSDGYHYYGNLAELHMASGNLENAIIFYQQAVSAGGGAPLRVGLAVALERSGRPDDAAEHLLRAVVDDPSGDFLDEEGVFFVPDGDVYLYRALVTLGRGDSEGALAALDAFGATPAAAGDEDLIARLRARAIRGGASVSRHSVSGCIPTHLALHPSEDHLAIVCEHAAIREIDLDGSGSRHETSLDDYFPYTRTDITYSPDGDTIRVLQTDAVCVSYERESNALPENDRILYEDYTLVPQRFIGDGDRILVTGSNSGGFQTETWDTAPLQPNLTYAGNVHWLHWPQMSADEMVLATADGASIRLLRPPSWTEPAAVRMTTGQSRFTPYGLSPSGTYLVTAHGSALVRYVTATGHPSAVVSLADIAPEIINDSHAGVVSIKAVDDDTYLVGTSGWVHVVRFH